MRPIKLIPGAYYHIYNRGNNRENIFVEEKNYHYFLKLFGRHVEPVASTFAYCLLRNHFHFLVRIKETPLPKPPSQAFSNLFNAYARAFNKMYERSGALFQRPFGRIQIKTDAHFRVLIAYIHQNPQKHGFVDDYRDWPYSSFHALMSKKETRLKRGEVLEWFDGQEGFINWHQQSLHQKAISALIQEDFY